ncbi:MAG: hypothetical protein A2504_13890 [Bdellovibrionales bacterium RIFOXYD12_FULL_39_22]|nr:MAG: hypothetical protein A2385_00615 [Bdellovibrionales bacterium RIFOXYB1_FULL_39_21]OFZ43820.1 MAG: hypothetical protein A2485_04915 [Bdellovibrionales bacterium RIFOXYC12_FULL_39_17]OFZ48846.1 MAG: hypothetical protein A2404_17930 [Bdellovibrionales bacterium RIFOXYC1_FULL_39_130]OFZ72067.1 MAG: hypothetical protein A2451_05515 [Bdellovibrionales bacterium RIFOXYC2_FULL_39_8]OFZ76579.1 MAG: hypothetical protein A2560_06595 [Bdellovibrionales bacterium RIFOXYD1_FULL_39_84]OFZ94813.1 MAG:
MIIHLLFFKLLLICVTSEISAKNGLANDIKTHHPINIIIQSKSDLPLENGKMTCKTCHSHFVDSKLPGKKGLGAGEHLQKEYSALCQCCHPEKTVRAFSHISDLNKFNKNSKEPVTCNNCHSMHFSDKKLIVLHGANLCLSCHEKQKKLPHKAPIIIQGSKEIYLNGDHLTCQTCHRTHGRSLSKHFLADETNPIVDFCASCHGKSALELYKSYHSILLKKK